MAVSRRTSKIALGGGVVLVAASLLWWWLAVPALVKYPTDLDVTPRYEGTFRLFVDPATAAPLPTPREVPLTVERHLEAREEASSASRVVVEETITQKAGSLFTATEEHAYVMDRRSMENLADERAYAFTPGNVVDRSGTYRLQLPMGTDADEAYDIYKNATATAYALVGDGDDPAGDVAGLDLAHFRATAEQVALSDVYLERLRALLPLPAEVTLDQLKPRLAGQGIDLDAILPGVLAVLSPEDQAALQQALAVPIPLRYVTTFHGSVAVEPDTGTEVDVRGVTETVAAQPVFENLDAVRGILARYAADPAVQAAAPAVEALASTPPSPVFQSEYAQTADSVADVASRAEDMRAEMRLAERWIPLSLLAAGVIALVLGVLARLRSRGSRLKAWERAPGWRRGLPWRGRGRSLPI